MSLFGAVPEDYPGLPPDAFDVRDEPADEPVDRHYIEALAANPAWQSLETELVDRASQMIAKLLAMTPRGATKDRPEQSRESFCAEVDALRMKIVGMLMILEEPVVIRRAIDARRDR